MYEFTECTYREWDLVAVSTLVGTGITALEVSLRLLTQRAMQIDKSSSAEARRASADNAPYARLASLEDDDDGMSEPRVGVLLAPGGAAIVDIDSHALDS